MRIRRRMMLLTTHIVLLTTSLLLGFIIFTVNTKFLQVERDRAMQDVQRVRQAMKSELATLVATTRDYAIWDDTWDFMGGDAPSYIDDNFTSMIYQNLGICLVDFYGENGERRLATWYADDPAGTPCDYSPAFVGDSSAFMAIRKEEAGFLRRGDDILLAASEPILRSDGTGPGRGNLIMCKRVDEGLIGRLGKQTEVPLSMDVSAPASARVAGLKPGRGGESFLIESPPGEDTLRGKISFAAADGTPAFVLHTTTPRPLKTEVLRLAGVIAGFLGLMAVFLIATIGLSFTAWVSNPLVAMETAVSAFTLRKKEASIAGGIDLIKPLQKRKDEIGHVAAAIGVMDERVKEEHDAVEMANARLESTVERRTAELKSANEGLQIYKKVLENTSESILVMDMEGHILDMNEAACASSGFGRAELLGKDSRILMSETQSAAYDSIRQAVLETGHWEGEVWDRRKDGTVYPKWQTINVVRNDGGPPSICIAISTDISSLKEAEKKLNHLAYYDQLTDLPNRALFTDRLRHQIECSRRLRAMFALLFVDLDRFKMVNDSLGHQQGDTLLVQVAQRLKECVRSSDTLCRVGGDEFMIVIQDIHRDANAGMVAGGVVRSLSKAFDVGGEELYVGASVGIAIFPKDGEDGETLVRKADAAMYLSKQEGRGMYRFASGDMDRENRERLEIEGRMHKALDAEEFRVYYQPQNLIAETERESPGGIVGAEALIRWVSSPGRIVGPSEFLPVAEETGFIAPLSDWVLARACQDAKKWLDGGVPIQVSVNVVPRQFDKGNLADRVAALLGETGLPPRLLKLEITESGFMRNLAHVRETMRRIREMGVTFAIDDFGTGYCSLQYLNQLPVDCLKIDKSFVQSIGTDGGEIVSAIISMARAFGISSVAEGVEEEAQLSLLREKGCDIVQGFYVSPPLSYEEFVAFIGCGDTVRAGCLA